MFLKLFNIKITRSSFKEVANKAVAILYVVATRAEELVLATRKGLLFIVSNLNDLAPFRPIYFYFLSLNYYIKTVIL